MEDKTLEALKGSIKKCTLFYDLTNYPDNEEENRKQCDGCPVFEKTKKRFCENTPFQAWKVVQVKGKYNWADDPVKQMWAKRELSFLVDLLPEEEKKNALKEYEGVINDKAG